MRHETKKNPSSILMCYLLFLLCDFSEENLLYIRDYYALL